MVFTALYLSIYMFTLVYLLFYITFLGSVKNIQRMTLGQIWFYYSTLTRLPSIFKFLFLNLSGLPPVFIFFIKFSFLLQCIQLIGLVYQAVIFSLFLVSMVYYLQIFNFTRVVSISTTKQILVFAKPQAISSRVLYAYIYSLYSFLFICFSGGIFWADFYLLSTVFSL